MPHASHASALITLQHEEHPRPMDDPGDHKPATNDSRFNPRRAHGQLAKGTQPVPFLQRTQMRHTVNHTPHEPILRFATAHRLQCQSHNQPVLRSHIPPDLPALL